MINLSLQVRRATGQDYDQIANLIYYEANSHRHLDWSSPLDWLGSPHYWVREENGQITAALACPEDPPHVAWIRFFGHHQYLSSNQAWSALWELARNEISQANQTSHIAAIAVKRWFQSLLFDSGFELRQNIVLLEWKNLGARPVPPPAGVRIRPMTDADMPAVAAVDFFAFGSFWHNSEGALQKARQQCASATVAEDESGILGYQLSAKNLLGAHLARLGVKPQAQGRGIGAALVSDLIQSLSAAQLGKFSVNTQSDNHASLALYKKMGFARTGEQFPVFVYPQ